MKGAERRKHYSLIGRILLAVDPERARKYLEDYNSAKPLETDIDKIPDLFVRFCHIRGIEPDEEKGVKFKTSALENRKLFISVLLHIYSPYVFFQSSLILKVGFVRKIDEVLSQNNEATVSRMIRNVVSFERIYEDYKKEVAGILRQLYPEKTIPEKNSPGLVSNFSHYKELKQK